MVRKQEDKPKNLPKIGDRVLVRGIPYSWDTNRAIVISNPYKYTDGSGWAVGVRYWDFLERSTKIVSVDRMVIIGEQRMKLSKPAITTGIVLLVALMLFGWVTGNYNGLVKQKAQVDLSWSKVETQYQRRLDLIDNIVGSVKGDFKQEQTVFGQIADARKQVSSGSSTNDKAAAASSNEATIVSIVPRLQEAYPELKSDGQVSKLIDELKTTENGIAGVRDGYNDTVTNYNVVIASFPKNFFAGIFNFDKANLFKADSSASKATKVQF